jgi:protein-tyrosine phosphatase
MSGFRFSDGKLILNMETFRRRSKGWQNDAPAYIHPRILFGAGIFITPEFVAKHKITHVINCASESDSPAWFRTKFPTKYSELNAIDSLDTNILHWYPKFEAVLHSFLSENSSQNIYVHCQCGINRSGFLALLFVCKKFNYSFKLATDSILKQRPCALTNSTYKEQVIEYIKNDFIKNHGTS